MNQTYTDESLVKKQIQVRDCNVCCLMLEPESSSCLNKKRESNRVLVIYRKRRERLCLYESVCLIVLRTVRIQSIAINLSRDDVVFVGLLLSSNRRFSLRTSSAT